MEQFKEMVKGALIFCMGITCEVSEVKYAFKEREGWDIEFIDTAGRYRHWKQWLDGGEITLPKPQKRGRGKGGIYAVNGEKRLINSFGGDVTDLFRKYGYTV